LEVELQIARGSIALATVLGERSGDDLLELPGSLGRSGPDRVRVLLQDRYYGVARGLAGERPGPGYHFVQHCTQAEDVGTSVDWLTAYLLRRHVSQRSHENSRIRMDGHGR